MKNSTLKTLDKDTFYFHIIEYKKKIEYDLKALRAVTEIAPFSLKEIERTWRDFVVHAATLQNKVSSLSHNFGKGRDCYASWASKNGILVQRKNGNMDDSLLRYIFAARDSEIHLIELITLHSPGGWEVGYRPAPNNHGVIGIRQMSTDGEGRLKSFDGFGAIPFEQKHLEACICIPIANRKHVHEVPTHHLGKPIRHKHPEGVTPLELASITNEYYFNLVSKLYDYFDIEISKQTRNSSCKCGSNKRFKHCCGM